MIAKIKNWHIRNYLRIDFAIGCYLVVNCIIGNPPYTMDFLWRILGVIVGFYLMVRAYRGKY
jgi:hypothetical protein